MQAVSDELANGLSDLNGGPENAYDAEIERERMNRLLDTLYWRLIIRNDVSCLEIEIWHARKAGMSWDRISSKWGISEGTARRKVKKLNGIVGSWGEIGGK